MLQTFLNIMSLMCLVRRITLPSFTPGLSLVASSPINSVLKFAPAVNFTPLRTYMDNFNNKNTAIKAPTGWMHKDRAREGYRTDKTRSRREYYQHYSEVKRVRTYGYEKRMSTEGGRKMLMRRMLRGKDDLAM